jgi:hypothetical protein
MNGRQLLDHAAGVVTDRRRAYGEPVDLFADVAMRWSLTLSGGKSGSGGALPDRPQARPAHDPKHLDSIVDVAGYAACLHEVNQ